MPTETYLQEQPQEEMQGKAPEQMPEEPQPQKEQPSPTSTATAAGKTFLQSTTDRALPMTP